MAHRALETTAIAAAILYFGVLGRLLTPTLSGLGAAIIALAAAFAAYLAADFVSGFVHWMGDRLGTIETPVFGPNFIGPFRQHHVDPEEIARHDFIETNGNNSIVLVPVQAAVAHLGPLVVGGSFAPFFYSFALFFGVSIFATNQFHKWAHAPAVPAWVKRLQGWNLILNPERHQIHHNAPFDTYFCITTGWLNAPLQRLRFFERMESLPWESFGLPGPAR